MAYLHFVVNETSTACVRHSGENPEHIHNVGSPDIGRKLRAWLLGRQESQHVPGLSCQKRYLLITCHPEVLDLRDAGEATAERVHARDKLDDARADVIFCSLIFAMTD